MLLYVCPECGAWEDKTIADAWAKAWQPVGKAFARGLAEAYGLKVEEESAEEPAGWACPIDSTHGLMHVVTSLDRLFIRPVLVEAEQGEDEKTLEPDESQKREQLLAEIEQLAGRRLGLVGMSNAKRASTARLEELLATVRENACYL